MVQIQQSFQKNVWKVWKVFRFKSSSSFKGSSVPSGYKVSWVSSGSLTSSGSSSSSAPSVTIDIDRRRANCYCRLERRASAGANFEQWNRQCRALLETALGAWNVVTLKMVWNRLIVWHFGQSARLEVYWGLYLACDIHIIKRKSFSAL